MLTYSQHGTFVIGFMLPPAIIVPISKLCCGYILALVLDYFIIKNEKKLSIANNTTYLCFFIGIYHFLLPIIFATKHSFLNIYFMLQPWMVAMQIVCSVNNEMTFREWLPMMIKIVTFQDENPTTADSKIRTNGMKKLIRGLTKFAFMKFIVDEVLLKDYTSLLELKFYSPRALFITYLLAAKIYCMLGVTDIVMGLLQTTFLIRFKDVFDNPFIATSPKDFWNRRWNKLVHDIFRRFLFSRAVTATSSQQVKKKDSRNTIIKTTGKLELMLSSPKLNGLSVFLISGLFHDLMVAAASRNITFELTAFFVIHGIEVMLEATLRKGRYKQDPTGIVRIFCIVLNTLFFTLTGRLFLRPILRQEAFLNIAHFF